MTLIDEDIWLHGRNHLPLKTSRQGRYVVCLFIIGILLLAMCLTGSELINRVLNIDAHVSKISRFLSPFRSESKFCSLPTEWIE